MDLGEVVRANPLGAAVSLAALCFVTLVAAVVLRGSLGRSTSLRRSVVAVVLASLALGALAAVLAARLMLLERAELGRFLGALAVAACFAVLLALVVTRPLANDVRRLESMVRRIEAGDRSVGSGIERADELGHVARALDDLTSRLDELERARAAVEAERRSLLSSVGHDLRTPLAALRAAVEALADGVAPDPDRYLRAMQHDLVALTALVDDLFLLAKLDAGRVELERVSVDLAELTDETLDALAPIARAKDVTLQLEAPAAVPVVGSPTALARVVRNLVDNAIRHAPPSSAVRVSLSAAPQVVTLRVRDEGPGFPAEFRSVAFDAFARPDPSRARSSGGSGLGLSIARGLVDAHGGEIWIDEVERGQVAVLLPAT